MKTSANITGVFDLDTGRLIGLAPKGTSDVTYVAGQDTATPAGALPVTATTDPVTGGISFNGIKQQQLGRTTILFGDSISQQQTDNIPTFTGSTELGYVHLAIAFAGGGWDVIRNAGVAGNTTAQMLARVDADVIAYKPDAVEFMGGTNDLGDPTVVIPNWLSIFAKLRAAGIYVRHYSILPRPALTATQKANIMQCNVWAQNYWRANGGGEYVDAFSAIVDPTSTTQAVLAGTLRTDDVGNIHPSAYGAQLIAAKAYPVYQRGGSSIILPSSAMDDYAVNSSAIQHIKNPLFLGSGGGSSGGTWSGTIPSNWTVSGPAGGAVSLSARSDGIGNNLRATFTPGAAGETYDIAQTSGVLGGNLAAGSKFFIVGSMKVISGGTNLRNFYAYMNTNGAFPSAADFCYPVVASNLPGSTNEMIFKTPVCTMRSDVTFAGFKFRMISAASGQVVAEVGRTAIYEYIP